VNYSGWVPNRLIVREGVPLLQLSYLESRRPMQQILEWDLDGVRNKRLLPLSTLVDVAPASPPASGMIFHTSRCGSTLLSDMFRALGHCKVISEPAVFADLLRHGSGSRGEFVRSLRGLASLYHRALVRGEERLIFKWTSWFCLSSDILYEAFPETPACFLFRDPVEVVISLLERPAVWLDNVSSSALHGTDGVGINTPAGSRDPLASLAREMRETGTDSSAELSARVLGLFCSRIANAGFPVLPVEYAALPDVMLTDVAPHFNVPINGVDKVRARAAARWNTKLIGAVKEFSDDSSSKREKASDEVLEAVEAYVLPALSEIREKGFRVSERRPEAPK
jgi:hypothetical protein